MQENQNSLPNWLQKYMFVDIKDKSNQWKVGLILNTTGNHIKVRYDGQSHKYDDTFNINSPNVKPFRSYTRGCNTLIQSQVSYRQQYTFSQENQKQKQKRLDQFMANFSTKSQFQITQYVRGQHYFWLDYLLSVTYKNATEINLVYEYFFKHFQLVNVYLQEMLKSQDFDAWFSGRVNGQFSESMKAFAECCYEIADSVYSLGLEGNSRLKTFIKNNQKLISQFVGQNENHVESMHSYLQQIGVTQYLQEVMVKIMNDNKSIIKLDFMTAIGRLFLGLQKSIKQKQKRRQQAIKLCKIMTRQCQKMHEISQKQVEIEIEKIYAMIKSFYHKYQLKQTDLLVNFQNINMMVWKSMIISQKLQRKIKGIYKLKHYYSQVTANNKQFYLIFNSRETVNGLMKKLQIFNAIFYQNQHHEIIKKGCQLAIYLYKENCILIGELEIIWNSCRKRLQAVRKVMYSFFQSICKQLKKDDLARIVKLIISQKFEEMDKNFFYTFFGNAVQSAKQQKAQILQQMFKFSYERILQSQVNHKKMIQTSQNMRKVRQIPQQARQFAQILTLNKSQKLEFTQKYANMFIKQISMQKYNDSMFYINLVNLIYSLNKTKNLDIQSSCFNKVFASLKNTLNVETTDKNPQIIAFKHERIAGLLKLFQNICSQFQLEHHQFLQLWFLFQNRTNMEFKQQQFLPWMIKTTYKGVLKLQHEELNHILSDSNLKKQMFISIFKKNSTNIDIFNISEMQFKIFKKLQLQVNRQMKNIQQFHENLTGIHYFRVSQKAQNILGLRQLIDIMINCRSQHVAKKAVRLIKQFHLNYKSDVDPQFRVRKIEELMLKIYKYVGQAFKKSNIKLIRNMLHLLYEIVVTVKQIIRLPHLPSHSYFKPGKKIIKVSKDDLETKDFQIPYSQSLKTLKNMISKYYNVPLYNLKLYKFSSKKVDDTEDFYSDASAAGSSHSATYTKNSPKFNAKATQPQQMAFQSLAGPVYTLTISDPQARLVVKEKPNILYQSISKFVCEKMSDQLLKILGDSQAFTKQSSQLAYHILIQIPSSMQSLEILNNLINQLKNKSTQLGMGMGLGQNHKKIDLTTQSINFRMYFCKNINRLKDNQFGHFLSQENVKNYEGIFTQISNRIIQNEQIQLIIQVINLAKRAISKMLISQNILNTENIFQCIINLMQFIIGPKNTEQFKKQQKYDQFDIEKKVFYQCLNVIELMHQNNKGRIVDTIVQSEYFQKLFVYLFKSMPKTQFADIFANKLDKFFKYAYKQRGYLEDKTQSKLCNVIFDVLYENVIKNKTRRNTAFFKIIRDLISISSSHSIQKLFTRDINNQKPSFWENCLNIIHQQSDFHNSQEKQNTFLTGHLYIVDSIIRRNPSIIDLNLCKMIFYNCLCYKQEETISEEVKCVSKSSINAALSAIYSMCCSNQLYVKFIVSELRRYQQIQYWRTPDFWAINSQLQAKSQCGFVGLVNPGCICYLNSFTQTLFMNEEFRNKVINFKEVNKATDYSLLIEMRKLFMYLQYSNQKSLSSVPFSQSIKSDQGKSIIKIFQQMDIEEYSSILFDRIQKILPKDQDFVKEIFGGTYSNDIISQQCKHSSQKQQNFLSMQVDLKPNLQQSLKTLVKGQILQGQNAYFCQKCNRKVKAVKRMSIKKLPNYLIISLKRFQYNFEIEGKIKINSLCEFSKQLSLQPYSQQFLNQQQDCNIRVEDPQTESQSQPQEYFNYKLKGVIIHTGSSQSGHYYTIIETSPDTWLQFNDSSVTEFDINKLPDEAFGCDDHSNPRAARNAYMLIYERKKKIYPMKEQKMQNQSQNSKQTYTEQAYSIYNQIRTNNKQIQTFHLVFGAQYFNFVKQLIALAKKQNYALKQFQKQMHIDKNISNLNLSDKQKSLHQQKQNQVIVVKQNRYSTDTIIQVLKFYFQYCIFIRARQANINAFLDCLQDLESMLSSSFCVPVLDYIIYELSQKLVIEQLLVQVSNKQKIIILSHFFLNILKLRITWWKSHYNTQTLINIMRLIQSFMQVIIQNSNCMNQILFIIRSIVEEDERILQYCQQINIFGNVFEIVSGVNQSDDQRLNKVQVLKKQVDYFIKKLVNSDGNQMEQMKQNQMVQQINEYFHNYSIRPVKKTGKCVLKLESPQQAWTYLYYIYKIQSQIYRKQELQNISSPQNSNQNQSSNQNQNSKSQFITIICHRKQFYQSEFIKLKDVRISHFIAESYGYRSSSALALFLCQMMNENQKIAQKIMNIIKDGLKKFQAIKFRPFLIVLFYVVMHEDSVQEFRNSFGIKLLTYALMENAKYFSQTDILHQWTIKMCLASGQFTQTIARTDEGSEILKQILSKVQIIKPTSEMMKKQKNAHYERLNYQIHGLMVSTEYQDYDRLKDIKRQFFQDIFHERPLSQEVKYQTKLLQFPQPTYAELTHRIVPGDILTYLFGRKWINVFVKSYRYGILKVHKIIKDTEKQKQKEKEKGKNDQVGNWKKKDNENKTSFIRINNKNIEIGSDNRLSEEQFTIYENDERLKNISQLKKYISKELQSQNNNKYTSNKDKTQKKINIQNDQQRSDLSYQSDNQG